MSVSRSGGQAVSWLIGIPRASACILEATVPYSMAACREKIAAGPPALGYCSPEVSKCRRLIVHSFFFFITYEYYVDGPVVGAFKIAEKKRRWDPRGEQACNEVFILGLLLL